MKVWFGAVREDGGGPTFHHHQNRMSVNIDMNIVYEIFVFFTFFIAFLVVLPGVRKERTITFVTVLILALVGFIIKVSMNGSSWQTSNVKMIDYADSQYKMDMEIGGFIGLKHINITYKTWRSTEMYGDLDYNERFYWEKPDSIKNQYENALEQGIPFPIIALLEYFIYHESFSWGRIYHDAGYYASVMLWASLVSWCITILFILLVPHYGPDGLIATGLLMMLVNCIYWWMLPREKFVAYVENTVIYFSFGWTFWLLLFGGIACSIAGIIFKCSTAYRPGMFSTALEVNHKAPYDRHVSNNNNVNERTEEDRRRDFVRQVVTRLTSSNLENIECGTVNRGYVVDDSEQSRD